VWAESLYVSESSRHQGIGGDLYQKAEEIGQKFHQDTIYNWIHPNNTKIINFLKKRGYDVLNLVEIRKKRKNETIQSEINIGDHSFGY
jgi:ribosomal protein S18 acetylase RimI-like enzyme